MDATLDIPLLNDTLETSASRLDKAISGTSEPLKNSSTLTFDIEGYKRVMAEEATKEAGWNIVYEGSFRTDLPNSYLKVAKKKMEGDSTVTLQTEGRLQGVKAENLYKMIFTPECVKHYPISPKVYKIVETIDANTDILYFEIASSFPMANRDYLEKRLYISSKDDAELTKRLGLYPEKKHNYYAVLISSCERDDYPPQKKIVRAEVKMTYWLIEEIPGEKNSLKFKTVSCVTLNGSIPLFLINDLAPRMSQKVMGMMLDTYYKCFGKVNV